MRTLVANASRATSMVSRVRPQDYLLSIVYVGRARLIPGAVARLLPDNDQPGIQFSSYYDDGEGNSLKREGDFAPFKPRTDVTLCACAYAPRGGRVTKLAATFGVGSWRKTLTILGKRVWHTGDDIHLSPPEAFTRMPIRLENAYGGLDSAFNPWGKGFGPPPEPGEEMEAASIHAENDLRSRWDLELPPDTFGPLSPDYAPRVALRGTHDKAWIFRRRPLPPLDFDWGHYNAAPPDQQFHPYLRGDEPLFFENLHSELERFVSTLPGIRARVFIRRLLNETDASQYEEIPARLDTVHIDLDGMTIDLAWRAACSTLDAAGADIPECYIIEEPLADAPLPALAHIEAFRAMIEPDSAPAFVPPPPEEPAPEADAEADAAILLRMQQFVAQQEFPAEFKEAIAKVRTKEEVDQLLEAETKRVLDVVGRLIGET